MSRFLADIRTHSISLYKINDSYLQACAREQRAQDTDPTALLAYLDNGKYMSILLDRGKYIFDNQSISSNETLLSDGNWIWSADLNHYTGFHHFIWPEAFLASIQNRIYKQVRIPGKRLREIEHLILDILRKVYHQEINPVYPNGRDETVYAERTYSITDLDTLI